MKLRETEFFQQFAAIALAASSWPLQFAFLAIPLSIAPTEIVRHT